MQKLFVLLLGFVFWITGCSSSVDSVEKVPQRVLLSSSERLIIDGQEITLNAYLWRDFAPVSPANGKHLTARIEVIASKGNDLPVGLDTDKVWIIVDGEVWSTFYTEELFKVDARRIVKIARDGPKFDVGKKAAVVVSINYKNNLYLLRSSDQKIQRTM